MQIGELERAAHHFRQMLIFARIYNKLDVLKMRELLADGLQKLFDIHQTTKQKVPFMPLEEDFAALEGMTESAATSDAAQLSLYELELYPDDRESFLPLAEMFLGNRREEIPAIKRTLDKHLAGSEKKLEPRKGGGSGMFSLGTEQRPIIVKVKSEEKGEKVARICERFGWHYIMGFEYAEDLTDLRKALKDTFGPANVYDPCLCGSGSKYKFCCAKKMKHFDIDQYIQEFISKD